MRKGCSESNQGAKIWQNDTMLASSAAVGWGQRLMTRFETIPQSFRWIPYSHAAGHTASEHIDLIAVSDVLPEKVKVIQERYNVPEGYTDYREMIRKEKPDIVSIATRPATHAEITVFAAENGVKGIYCEKPLCCSMEEADAMLEACEKHGVKFNYGTQRRYMPTLSENAGTNRPGRVG